MESSSRISDSRPGGGPLAFIFSILRPSERSAQGLSKYMFHGFSVCVWTALIYLSSNQFQLWSWTGMEPDGVPIFKLPLVVLLLSGFIGSGSVGPVAWALYSFLGYLQMPGFPPAQINLTYAVPHFIPFFSIAWMAGMPIMSRHRNIEPMDFPWLQALIWCLIILFLLKCYQLFLYFTHLGYMDVEALKELISARLWLHIAANSLVTATAAKIYFLIFEMIRRH